MKRFTRCLSMFLLIMGIVGSLSIPAFAANESYSFDVVGDQTQKYKISYTNYNVKTIPGDAATVQTNSETTFAGSYPWAFRLYYWGYNASTDSKDKYYSPATYAVFMRGAYTTHPSYLSGQNITNRKYYVGGRLDDRVTDPNTYHAEGLFNADYTTP